MPNKPKPKPKTEDKKVTSSVEKPITGKTTTAKPSSTKSGSSSHGC